MGSFVAKVLQHRLKQRTAGSSQPYPKAFSYQDFGNLATIGRLAAIVDLRGFKFSGMSAWIFWLAAHVFFLIGFRNRILVMINWMWAYFSYERHARVIYDVAASPSTETPPRTPQDPLP
jgi:NADH:ubiquinone reductase (H+-translocating)